MRKLILTAALCAALVGAKAQTATLETKVCTSCERIEKAVLHPLSKYHYLIQSDNQTARFEVDELGKTVRFEAGTVLDITNNICSLDGSKQIIECTEGVQITLFFDAAKKFVGYQIKH